MRRKRVTREIRRWGTLRWRLSMFVFAIMLLSGILTALVFMILNLTIGFSPILTAIAFNPTTLIIVLLCVCTLIGTALAIYFSTYYLRPLKRLISATHEVKNGNFKVQVRIDDHQAKSDVSVKPPREMDILIESFNDMVRELDSIELLRNDFINNFSHEFKTPIVSICGFAKELQTQGLSEEQRREYATIIAEESDRLSRLARNVLELSKLENRQILNDKAEFYLDEQLRQCILLFEQSWMDKQIEIIPELEEIKIYSDEELLSHVWNNLISNAIKFTPPEGKITVTLVRRDNLAVVTVADSGIGMSEEVKNHIFEKFYQGDPSHHHKGYGIGLSMVDRALRLANGKIEVESTLGVGSTFTVYLPLEKKKDSVIAEMA